MILELDLLHGRGRVSRPAIDVIGDLVTRIDLRIAGTQFARVVAHSLDVDWTRDPFDRLIVGNAVADGAFLLTKDREILEHFDGALWDRPPRRSRS